MTTPVSDPLRLAPHSFELEEATLGAALMGGSAVKVMRLGIGVALIPIVWMQVTQLWQAVLADAFAAATGTAYNRGVFTLRRHAAAGRGAGA